MGTTSDADPFAGVTTSAIASSPTATSSEQSAGTNRSKCKNTLTSFGDTRLPASTSPATPYILSSTNTSPHPDTCDGDPSFQKTLFANTESNKSSGANPHCRRTSGRKCRKIILITCHQGTRTPTTYRPRTPEKRTSACPTTPSCIPAVGAKTGTSTLASSTTGHRATKKMKND